MDKNVTYKISENCRAFTVALIAIITIAYIWIRR
jgi:hypothetical protein